MNAPTPERPAAIEAGMRDAGLIDDAGLDAEDHAYIGRHRAGLDGMIARRAAE